MSKPSRKPRTTTERGLGWEWQQIRLQILARDAGLCQVCKRNGLLTQATEVDHIKPRKKGGTHDARNLQVICSQCHVEKTAADEGKTRRAAIGADGWPIA